MTTGSNDSNERWAPRFFLIWTGQAFSLLGSSLVQFALVWWMTKETGSATVLATATLVALLPQVFLGPFIGPLIDRLDRRRIMIVADSGIALVTAGLLLLFLSGRAEVWHIFVSLALRSLGEAFHHPAMTASTSLMVPERHLTRVNGLNHGLRGVMNIIAPPLGAVLIMLLPTHGVLAIDLVTAALAVLPLLLVRLPAPPRQAGNRAQATSYRQDLKAGLLYVVRWPGLFGLILLAMLLNFLLVPSGSLLPLLITKVFERGALELAWVQTAMGIGVIAGGLLLSAWGGFKKRILTSLVGIVGLGTAVLLTGLAPTSVFPLVLAAGGLLGLTQVIANGPLGAIFQSCIDPDMQGRVFSLLNAGATAMMPLSLAIAGPVADRLGLRTWYIVGGGLCVLVALGATLVPAIMQIEQNSHKAVREGAASEVGGTSGIDATAPVADPGSTTVV